MMLLFRISVQLSVELLIAHAVCNSQHKSGKSEQAIFSTLSI